MFADEVNDEAEFLVGDAASLSPLRAAMATGNEEAVNVALKQLLNSSAEERILVPRFAAAISLQQSSEEQINHDGENRNGDSAVGGFQSVPGSSILTSERFLFVASPVNGQPPDEVKKYDLSIDAECIHLHAQSASPVSIYLQLASENDEANTTEVTIVPNAADKQEMAEKCEQLFNKFSELIALHPISPDDNGDSAGGMMGMMSMMMGAAGEEGEHGMINGHQNGHIEDYGDDMIVAPSSNALHGFPSIPHQFDDCDEEDEHNDDSQRQWKRKHQGSDYDDSSDPGVTLEEREAMLAHLDSLLVVKPGLEIKDEQFDDAEADDLEAMADSSNHAALIETQTKAPDKNSGRFDDADEENDPLL